jgi:hypothetical protein
MELVSSLEELRNASYTPRFRCHSNKNTVYKYSSFVLFVIRDQSSDPRATFFFGQSLTHGFFNNVAKYVSQLREKLVRLFHMS